MDGGDRADLPLSLWFEAKFDNFFGNHPDTAFFLRRVNCRQYLNLH